MLAIDCRMKGLLVPILALLAVATAQVDETVQPGAIGASVVEAVVNKIDSSCVFGEDKLFTRRLSYVESTDGHDADTFRPDYFGGIWQVLLLPVVSDFSTNCH